MIVVILRTFVFIPAISLQQLALLQRQQRQRKRMALQYTTASAFIGAY